MPTSSTLLLFAVTALALVAVPGPNIVYIVTRSLQLGSRAGVASALGVETGTLVHVGAAAAGLSAALASSPTAFTVVKYAGIAYLLYLAARALTAAHHPAPAEAAESSTAPDSRVYLDGLLVQLLNPKVALFFLALLPQFVDPQAGAAWTQIIVLGAILTAIGLASDIVYALLAGRAGARLRARPGSARWGRFVAAGVYLSLAAVALVGGRRHTS